jgi:hypothetical protein
MYGLCLGLKFEVVLLCCAVLKVLACPPVSCLSYGCPGHELHKKGIAGCLNTSAPVGTTWDLPLVVFDANNPPGSATVHRTISITQPCSGSQFLCNGTCVLVRV